MRELMLWIVVIAAVGGAANAADTKKSSNASAVVLDRAAATEQVRAAETAFAKAFADHDTAHFVEMLDENATFMSSKGTLHGKENVARVWSRMVAQPKAPFSWGPERVEVSGDGTIGYSSGSVRDAGGREIAIYTSIWQRQHDGSWKVIFDGPGCAVAPPAN